MLVLVAMPISLKGATGIILKSGPVILDKVVFHDDELGVAAEKIRPLLMAIVVVLVGVIEIQPCVGVMMQA